MHERLYNQQLIQHIAVWREPRDSEKHLYISENDKSLRFLGTIQLSITFYLQIYQIFWWGNICTDRDILWHTFQYHFNTLRPRQNCGHFIDNIFKCIFLNDTFWILNQNWNMFLMVWLTIGQHWFRLWLGAEHVLWHSWRLISSTFSAVLYS